MFFIGENKKILRHVQNYFNSISTEDIELQEEVERLDTAIIEAEEEHAKYEKRWNRKSDVVFYLFSSGPSRFSSLIPRCRHWSSVSYSDSFGERDAGGVDAST